jgi:hypothetical protein
MINLFDRVYLRHDNLLVTGKGQQSLIITPKEFELVYTNDRLSMQSAGIIDIHTSLAAADEKYGNRETMWAMLRLRSAKICIIADRFTAAEILIQFWKSIFAKTTEHSLYQLYKLTINNENLHSFRYRERSAVITAPNSTEGLIEKLDFAEFCTVYERAEKSETMSTLEARHIPFEYLLLGYLAGTLTDKAKKVFFQKVDMIVKQNIVGELISARDDFFFETHNYYLLNKDGQEVVIDDPLDYIKNHPMLAWAMDPIFEYGLEEEVLKKYPLQTLKGFFETYHELFRYTFDDYYAIEYIQNKDYRGLIDFDMKDQKGNFFCSTAFVSKINGLLVSYIYQMKRLGEEQNLQLYQLNHV